MATTFSDRAWVDVDLDAVVANARHVAATSGARLLPMVKANAYGLGVVPVARALESVDPWGFGVATPDEGAELRAASVRRPIVVFTPVLAENLEHCRQHDLRPALSDIDALRAWLARFPEQPFHLAIDTGMARAGFAQDDAAGIMAARDLVRGVAAYEGICTHFHSADVDPAATARQWRRFMEIVGVVGRPAFVHAANSAAALAGSRYAGDLVRPGIYLYGGRAGDMVPRSVAALRAPVVGLRTVAAGESVSYRASWRAERDATIAAIAIGYADGVPRALSDRGVIELRGMRAPIRGRVTMDMTLVEAPPGIELGDIATVFGGDVSLDEQAEAAGTLSYEMLTRLGARVERRYGEAS